MIIKSMSRKEPSFGALMDYIDRELGQEETRIRHNLMGRGRDRIRAEFERNGHLLRRRKNGVYLYHEIISLTRAQGISAKEQHELLHRIVQQYIAARCPDNLCYGGMHQDKDHSYHFHLMISANRAGEEKRFRLTKGQFREIQVQLEAHVLEHYPQLEQQLAIGKRADRKSSRGAIEHERRTGRPPSRQETLLGRLRAAYEASGDRDSLEAALAAQGFRHEPRGKVFARVIDEYSTKPHRIKTLDPDLAVLIEKRLNEPQQQHAEAKAEPESEAQPEAGPKSETNNRRAARGADEKEKSADAGAVDYGRSRAEARVTQDIERHLEAESGPDDAKEDRDVLEPEEETAMNQARSPEERDEDHEDTPQVAPEAEPDPLSEVQKGWKQSIRAARTAIFGPDRDEDHER